MRSEHGFWGVCGVGTAFGDGGVLVGVAGIGGKCGAADNLVGIAGGRGVGSGACCGIVYVAGGAIQGGVGVVVLELLWSLSYVVI